MTPMLHSAATNSTRSVNSSSATAPARYAPEGTGPLSLLLTLTCEPLIQYWLFAAGGAALLSMWIQHVFLHKVLLPDLPWFSVRASVCTWFSYGGDADPLVTALPRTSSLGPSGPSMRHYTTAQTSIKA